MKKPVVTDPVGIAGPAPFERKEAGVTGAWPESAAWIRIQFLQPQRPSLVSNTLKEWIISCKLGAENSSFLDLCQNQRPNETAVIGVTREHHLASVVLPFHHLDKHVQKLGKIYGVGRTGPILPGAQGHRRGRAGQRKRACKRTRKPRWLRVNPGAKTRGEDREEPKIKDDSNAMEPRSAIERQGRSHIYLMSSSSSA